MPTINVLDATGQSVAVELPNADGRQAAAGSRPVVLASEDLAAINALGTALADILAKIIAAPATAANQATIIGHVDGIEASLASILAKLIVAPATEAKQDTLIGHVDGIEAALTSILAKIIAAPATEAKQDSLLAAVQAGTEYETVAASQTNQTIGATGAAGDLLNGLLVIPTTTSPGAVAIKDGSGTAITVFAGGASSVSGLVPFFVPLGIRSAAGAWQVTTGANVSVIAVGDFT